MKLEIIFALLVGTILGLGSMFVIVTITTKVQPQKEQKSPAPAQTQQNSNTVSSRLLNNVSWSDTPIPFSGESKDDSFVFISSKNQDFVVLVKDNKYERQIPAVSGLNQYFVFNPGGEQISSSTFFSLKQLPHEKALHQGTITDITQDGFQMREQNGTITQAKYSKNVEFVSILKDYKKVTQSDIAIGDYITALEELTEKGVILTSHVIISPLREEEYKPVLLSAPLKAFTKNSLTLIIQGSEKVISTNSATKFYGLKPDGNVRNRTKFINTDLETPIYTILTDSTNSTARSVFISEK